MKEQYKLPKKIVLGINNMTYGKAFAYEVAVAASVGPGEDFEDAANRVLQWLGLLLLGNKEIYDCHDCSISSKDIQYSIHEETE